MARVITNRYAGDAAWEEWFRICSVGGCSADSSAKLREQVAHAMVAQLGRYGLATEEAGGDDPVAFFDAYFKLKGSQEKPKPLKQYFAHRIVADGLKMVNFVCGTLFGSQAGRIHDIVLDWIATLKGWKPRSLRGADGKRHLVWENAGPEAITELELGVENDPASTVEAENDRRLALEILNRISSKIKTEKEKVALLLYATAQDVSITDAAVLEGLEVEKSRAYALREKAMSCLRKELKDIDGAGDPLFVRMLLETCEATLTERVRTQLGGVE